MTSHQKSRLLAAFALLFQDCQDFFLQPFGEQQERGGYLLVLRNQFLWNNAHTADGNIDTFVRVAVADFIRLCLQFIGEFFVQQPISLILRCLIEYPHNIRGTGGVACAGVVPVERHVSAVSLFKGIGFLQR